MNQLFKIHFRKNNEFVRLAIAPNAAAALAQCPSVNVRFMFKAVRVTKAEIASSPSLQRLVANI